MIPREFSNTAFLTVALPYAWIIIAAFIFHPLRAPHALDKEREKLIEERDSEAVSLREQLATESARLKKETEQRRRMAEYECSQKEAAETRANRFEADFYEVRDQLKEQKAEHKADVERLQAHIQTTHEKSREKLFAHMKEVGDLTSEVLRLRSKNADLIKQIEDDRTTFEVSTEIRESTVCLTDSGDVDDWRDATEFCLEAKFFIRYCNDSPEPIPSTWF